jgi:16S rRNA U516 pseudouridylate synthase RsuA-like enzyme
MADACKLTVTKLKRIRIGHMTVGKMTAGNFKRIPDYYVQEMRKD